MNLGDSFALQDKERTKRKIYDKELELELELVRRHTLIWGLKIVAAH